MNEASEMTCHSRLPVAVAMAGTWAPAQSLQQVPAAAAEIASVLGSEELLDSVRCCL